MEDSSTHSPRSAKAWLFSRPGRLSLALLTVELIAGMQTFMQATIGPEIAGELHAEEFFGLIYSAVLASSFLTLPWGPKLIGAIGVGRLMMILTIVNAMGAVVSASAPNIAIFILGRIIAGLSAGVMATASMSAVVQHLPTRWRQIVLATFSATYILSSAFGPAYAATVTSLFNWRISMVLYVPFLVLARLVIARNVNHSLPPKPATKTPPLVIVLTLPLAAFGISIAGTLSPQAGVPVVILGMTTIVFGAFKLLPKGTFSGQPGRPRAVLLFFLITGLYFAVDSVLPLLARNVTDASTADVGLMLTVGGLAWAIVGFLCGRRPAATTDSFKGRVSLGIVLLFTGTVCIGLISTFAPVLAVYAFIVGWGIASIGMGLSYLDTMNAIFTPPSPDGDSMSDDDAVTAVAYSEQIAAILLATPSATFAGYLVDQTQGELGLYLVIALGGMFLLLLLLAQRAGDALSDEAISD